MFEDPGIDLTTRPILEQMLQLTICRITAAMDSNNNKVDSDDGEYSLFLAFPNEIISRVFKWLDIKTRLKLRLNKRLTAIELESKFCVDNLLIEEKSINRTFMSLWDGKSQRILLSKENIDCLKKLASNTFIRRLTVQLAGSDVFHRAVCELIKSFDLDFLFLRFEDHSIGEQVLVDSYLMDLAKSCKTLIVRQIDNVTPEGLYQLYKMMLDGSAKLRSFDVTRRVDGRTCTAFLDLLGVSNRAGTVYSKRDVEVLSNGTSSYYIFDGFFEIFAELSFTNSFHLKLHENRISLEKAKNKRGFKAMTVIVA